MKNDKLDSTDLTLIRYLSEDGLIPVKELAEKLQVTPPTVYSRIKSMLATGVLKITGQVDIFKLGSYQTAIVAINVNDDSKLSAIMDALDDFEEVQWSVAVTGRYDIFVEVILEESMEALFNFHSEKLSKLDGISNSESFVIMKTKNKWFSLASTNTGKTDRPKT
jgi:Lrp/AsnC family transcriptional regulator, regulator for asnA, asnC and gidA